MGKLGEDEDCVTKAVQIYVSQSEEGSRKRTGGTAPGVLDSRTTIPDDNQSKKN